MWQLPDQPRIEDLDARALHEECDDSCCEHWIHNPDYDATVQGSPRYIDTEHTMLLRRSDVMALINRINELESNFS